jgi:hypothetical protein
MPIFSDPRLDPVDINSSEEYFPTVTTPEVMALHMTRQWKAVTSSTDDKALNAIYAMWLAAYRELWTWQDEHPSATPDDVKASAEDIVARVCSEYGTPRRHPGANQ